MTQFHLCSLLCLGALFLFGHDNLLKNGSFEQWSAGALLPAHWHNDHAHKDSSSYAAKVTCDSSISSHGSRAVHFHDAGMKHSLRQAIPVNPGEFYDISCRVKTKINMYEFRLMNHWRDPKGKYLHNITELSVPCYARGTNDWMSIDLKNLQAPPTAVSLVVCLVPNDAWSDRTVPGDIWVDQVRVVRSRIHSTASEAYRPLCLVPLYDDLSLSLDGKATEPAWAQASVITHLVSPKVFSPEGPSSEIRIVADSKALWVHGCMRRSPSSTISQAGKQERDKGIMNDLLELFFKPREGDPQQYHFMFDASGSIWDERQTYTTGILPDGQFLPVKNDTAWTCRGLSIKLDNQPQTWSFECRIPYADLNMKPPQDGDCIRANICRADYGGNAHNLLKAWGLHRLGHFANYTEWGTLLFSRQRIAVRHTELQPTSQQAAVTLSGAKMFSGKICVETLQGDKALLLGEQSVHVPAGTERTFVVPLNSQGKVYWISVYQGGTLIYRRGGMPYGTSLFIGLCDPLNIRKRNVFIANDTRWHTRFSIQHTLTGKRGNKVYGNPPELNARIIAEVPEGITIPFLCYSNWGGDNLPQKPLSQRSIIKHGKPYVRFELPGYISGVNAPLIYFTSSLPTGTRGKLYLYMTWNGGSQTPSEHEFTIVSLGRVKPFERMQLRMDDLPPRAALQISDDPARDLPTLGINVFRIPMNPSKSKLYYAETGETCAQRYDRLYRDMVASGYKWYFCIQQELNDALRPWCNQFDWGNPLKLTADPSGRFCDIDGKPVRNQYGWYSPCLMYRGRNYQKQIEAIIQSEAFRKYGVTWLVLDWEFWDDHPCYCRRCVEELWPAYLKEHKLPAYGDPRVFMKDEKQYPDAAKAWRRFYAHNRGAIYTDLKADLMRHLPTDQDWSHSPKPGTIAVSDWMAPKPHLIERMDFFDWPFAYSSPLASAPRVKRLFTEVLKGSSKQIVASFNSMQGCELNEQYPPKSTYYNILEAATLGVQGFEWWYFPVIETMSYKYIMDGLRMIRPFEDLILDGKVMVHAEGIGCTFRTVTRNQETLACVRNYTLTKPQLVRFTIKGRKGDEVIDTATGHCLARLNDGGNQISLELDGANQARLLYVGRDYERRQTAVTWSQCP